MFQQSRQLIFMQKKTNKQRNYKFLRLKILFCYENRRLTNNSVCLKWQLKIMFPSRRGHETFCFWSGSHWHSAVVGLGIGATLPFFFCTISACGDRLTETCLRIDQVLVSLNIFFHEGGNLFPVGTSLAHSFYFNFIETEVFKTAGVSDVNR